MPWTLFCTNPWFCNYRSFCILGSITHVQLTRDTETHENKLKTTIFHKLFMLCSPVFTRAPFEKIPTLAHTIWDLFGMCELPISFPTNMVVIFLHFQAWKARESFLTWTRYYSKTSLWFLRFKLFQPQIFAHKASSASFEANCITTLPLNHLNHTSCFFYCWPLKLQLEM